MLWFTLFLLCIALEIITGTGWLLLISLGALSSAIVGFFLPISQEANICFFASISILASIIKLFYDKKHKKLDTLLVNT
ncbi:TPA: NfeD family protein, partial [Escherichia coli]